MSKLHPVGHTTLNFVQRLRTAAVAVPVKTCKRPTLRVAGTMASDSVQPWFWLIGAARALAGALPKVEQVVAALEAAMVAQLVGQLLTQPVAHLVAALLAA